MFFFVIRLRIAALTRKAEMQVQINKVNGSQKRRLNLSCSTKEYVKLVQVMGILHCSTNVGTNCTAEKSSRGQTQMKMFRFNIEIYIFFEFIGA